MTVKTTKNSLTVRFTKREIENLNNPKKYKTKNYFAEMEVWDVPLVITVTLGQLKILPTPPTAYGFNKPSIDTNTAPGLQTSDCVARYESS